ncbi:uncharacterized protein Z518_10748 [Rhinocladiella mackenziei CBS 650.93]|uniref:HNH nuclease domain-containing protein n=1 Tax=Rhinocladiella mackenziei CBS 650.93 TaxID=1442369 RepID=A0A0D2I983_9EURO|nr:uncharacterized protein Z518_10748 [Rhinocladiella mackenziei CBS 650.93]KIW99820.1 hypothetical protein Z518_10748 [Rhinocladiella mackenziei CBS 650.93]
MAGSSNKGTTKSPERQKGKAPASGTGSAGFNNEDYNIRSPERTKVLTQIKECNRQPSRHSCLLGLLSARRYEPPGSYRQMGTGSNYFLRESGLCHSNAMESAIPGFRIPRIRDRLCRERDDYRCVLTRRPHPQVAHIFPHSVLDPRPRAGRNKTSNAIPGFWQSSRVFWDKDRVNKWKNTVFPDSENPEIGIEPCFNLISLSPDAHDMWNRGVFALKPLNLSHDRKKLTVQFFWHVPGKYDIGSQIDLLTEPTSSEGLDFVADGYCLTRVEREGSHPRLRHICSGEKFTFATNDPTNLPLPSVELLDMQWALQRLMGMCSAAGWPSLEDDDGVDSDDDWHVPDDTYSNAHNSLKRVHQWVGTEKGAGVTPEISMPMPSPSMTECP